MTIETSKSSETVSGAVARKTGFVDGMSAGGVFTITCVDKDGNVKWVDIAPNLVTNVGVQDMNNKYFTGSSYTAGWYVGLVNDKAANSTFSYGDTLASTTAGMRCRKTSRRRTAPMRGTSGRLRPSRSAGLRS